MKEENNLSKNLQLGKAGEHFVCCDLILQGYNAFLADQGLPYDVVVEVDGQLKKIQTKVTTHLKSWDKAENIYRFGTRRGKGSRVRIREADVDYFAFVALDIKEVAYFSISKMLARSGKVKQTVDFKTRRVKYTGRIYSTGKTRIPEWGKYFEDYSKFGGE